MKDNNTDYIQYNAVAQITAAEHRVLPGGGTPESLWRPLG